MSATDFLPRRGVDLRTWSINFESRISADPLAYGLTAAQAVEYSAAHSAFMAAWALAAAPGTRTSPMVQSQNAAMQALRREARRLARIVHANRIVSDAQKKELGLTVARPGGRQARLSPPGEGLIVVVEAVAGGLEVRLRSAAGPTRRGRPEGVASASVFFFAGEAPPVEARQWQYAGATTRTRWVVAWPRHVERGARVWWTACWRNGRAECGPLARPVCIYRPRGTVEIGALRLAA